MNAAVVAVLRSSRMEPVLLGPKVIVHNMKTGSVVVAGIPASSAFAEEMEMICKAVYAHYLDEPISDGSVNAADGDFSIIAAGTPAAFTVASPMLEAAGDTIFELGDENGRLGHEGI